MRLRPGLRVLPLTDTEVQIGLDPRWAVRLTGLSGTETALLEAVAVGTTERALRAEADRRGMPARRVDELLGALADARLLTPAPDRARPALRGAPAADARRWSLLLDDGDGAAMVAARRSRSVGVSGLGRTGLTAATTLATAGVGTVLLDDPTPVTPDDLGNGYRVGDLGTSRAEAAARALRDAAPEVRTAAAAPARPDVLVLVEEDAADPARAHVLMGADLTHLSVVVREADVQVGPLVRPGSGACLRCLDLHRRDADPAWTTVLAQLGGTRRRGLAEDGVLSTVAGALAAHEVLAHLDGRPARTRSATLEMALPDALPRVREWQPHAECGCRGPDARLPVARPLRATGSR